MRPGRWSTFAAAASCAALAVTLTVVVTEAEPEPPGASSQPTASIVPATRPPDLSRADIARYARAFGIRGEPEREIVYWEAADPERSIVLQRAPESWYVLFTDSSVLAEPPTPGSSLPPAASQPGPSAATALAAARRVLTRAGALPGHWDARIGITSAMPLVCRPVPSPYDCPTVQLATRHVVFTRAVNGRPTTVQWEVLVGPGARILDAIGRVAIVIGS